MHQIRIEGQYHGEYLMIHREYPSKWQEFTRDHLLAWAEVLSSDVDPERYAEMLLYRWLRITPNIFFNLDRTYIEQLAATLAYLVADNTLDKVLITEFTHEGKTYMGPNDGFINVSFLEWILAENAFRKYQKTKRDEDLCTIIHCLYRKRRNDLHKNSPEYRGDLRELLNEHNVNERAEVFSTLESKMKMAVLITFIGNRNTVINRFRPVFDYASEKKMSDMYGSVGVIVGMVGDKWGTRQQIEQANAYEVFISWHQNIERLEEYERQMEEYK